VLSLCLRAAGKLLHAGNVPHGIGLERVEGLPARDQHKTSHLLVDKPEKLLSTQALGHAGTKPRTLHKSSPFEAQKFALCLAQKFALCPVIHHKSSPLAIEPAQKFALCFV
jgi:hypothetical protein